MSEVVVSSVVSMITICIACMALGINLEHLVILIYKAITKEKSGTIGKQEMGTICIEYFDGTMVNGSLYYRDDDGNFVKFMTVMGIEETTNGELVDIKVNGYPVSETEKEETE